MVGRSVAFWEEYGPIVKHGFTFENPLSGLVNSGYTETVSSGDGDYLSATTLWDFKVAKTKPTSKHTLQLLMYWIMGQHSGQDIFRQVTKLGIYNPRLNSVYLLDTSAILQDVIKDVEDNVICY